MNRRKYVSPLCKNVTVRMDQLLISGSPFNVWDENAGTGVSGLSRHRNKLWDDFEEEE